MILHNQHNITKHEKKRDSIEIDRVGIKEYISEVVSKINKLEIPKRQEKIIEEDDNDVNLLNLPTNRSNF